MVLLLRHRRIHEITATTTNAQKRPSRAWTYSALSKCAASSAVCRVVSQIEDSLRTRVGNDRSPLRLEAPPMDSCRLRYQGTSLEIPPRDCSNRSADSSPRFVRIRFRTPFISL